MKRTIKIKFIIKKVTIILGIIAVGVGVTSMSFDKINNSHQISDLELNVKNNFDIKNEIEMKYVVRGNYEKPLSKSLLLGANTLGDIIENYPSSWIKKYTSVEITSIFNGDKSSKTGANNILTEEQKTLFLNSKVGSTFDFKVKYKREDSKENRELNVSFSLIPELEAKYERGHDNLIAYLKNGSKGKLNLEKIDTQKIGPNEIVVPKNLEVLFVVNKNGRVENVRIENSSNNIETDKLIIDLVTSMSKWKPAKNIKGEFVNQEFMFTVGILGC